MGPVFSMEARIKPIFSALDGAWYRYFTRRANNPSGGPYPPDLKHRERVP